MKARSAAKTTTKSMATPKTAPFSVKSVFIIYRRNTPEANKMARELALWLGDRKIKAFTHQEQRMVSRAPKAPPRAAAKADLVVALGGDGTYLEAVRLLNGQKVPILGVNMGSLGFLTETRVEDLFKAVELVLSGRMEQRPRSMLHCEIRRQGRIVSIFTALNDVVIERGPYTHLINIAIASDSQPVSDVKADGLIIASPTGSTAYNLAAGGPILHPQVQAIVLTPICPHSLTNRPLIFPDELELNLRLKSGKQKAVVTVDGLRRAEISPEEEVVIKKADCYHFVLREPSHNYFQLLRQKLKFGERA